MEKIRVPEFDSTPDKVRIPDLKKPEEGEKSLRPTRLSEYIGQAKVVEQLKIYINAAKMRQESLDHILLFGPPGLGKTTLSRIVANEMDVNVKVTSGPAIERPGDLAAILTGLQEGDILFIDEIHRLSRVIEETLYPAMEDQAIDIMIGHGPEAKSIRIDLPSFTLIGATTQAGNLSNPLRDRFGVVLKLSLYEEGSLKEIVERSADVLNIRIDSSAAEEIARRSRGTPRIANRLLKRVRDFAQVAAQSVISRQVASDALRVLEIDKYGLDSVDMKILRIIEDNYSGGPVGLDALAASSGEERSTIEEAYEPYLLQIGFLCRTTRGRVITDKAREHLDRRLEEDEDRLRKPA